MVMGTLWTWGLLSGCWMSWDELRAWTVRAPEPGSDSAVMAADSAGGEDTEEEVGADSEPGGGDGGDSEGGVDTEPQGGGDSEPAGGDSGGGGDSAGIVSCESESLEMLLIPGGGFRMGSSESEVGREEDEDQRMVTLTTDFCIGAYEVMQGQFLDKMKYNPSQHHACGLDCPVDWVS